MKSKIIFILMLLYVSQVMAQNESDPPYETIFSKRANRASSNVRGYGGLIFKYDPISYNGLNHLLSTGIRGGVTIKRKYSIGLNGVGIGEYPKNNPLLNPDDDKKSIQIDQMALDFTYRPKPEEAFHLAYNLLVGGLIINELTLTGNNIYESAYKGGFMINPNISYELNLMSWISVNAAAGYRVAIGKDAFGINVGKNLSGFTFQLGINFGKLR